MEQFMGTWKLTASENFDEYMKAVGKLATFIDLPHTKLHVDRMSACFHLESHI